MKWDNERERWAVGVVNPICGAVISERVLVRAQNLVLAQKLWLSTENDGGVEFGLMPSFYQLKVMLQDGTMRDAHSLYEWVQQFCIEQCALLLAMDEKGLLAPNKRGFPEETFDEQGLEAGMGSKSSCCAIRRKHASAHHGQKFWRSRVRSRGRVRRRGKGCAMGLRWVDGRGPTTRSLSGHDEP